MKKKFLGRVLTMLLVASMVFTLLPAPAIAAGNWWWNNDEYTEEAVPTATTDDYDRILHLDCGRKYFTKDWIIALLHEMQAAGYNQLELAFGNDGLRFLLDNMSFTANETTYDYDTIVQKVEAGNKLQNSSDDARWLTETEMNEIIATAKGLGIEIVPLLNLPGHANTVLDIVDNNAYNAKIYGTVSQNTLDVTNAKATEFAYALFKKYVDYFASKGCKYFNFGADEYGNDTGDGNPHFDVLQDSGYQSLSAFINKLAGYIDGMGMTPRAFNDGLYYNSWDMDTATNDSIKKIQCCYWSSGWGSYPVASAKTIASKGHKMINTHGDWYYVLGKTDNFDKSSTSYAAGFENTSFAGNKTISNPVGSMFCIWCDYPNAETETQVAQKTRLVLRAMAARMQNKSIDTISYDVVPGGFNEDGSLTTTTPTPPDGGTTTGQTIEVLVGGKYDLKLDGNVEVVTDRNYDPSIAGYTSVSAPETTTTETPVSKDELTSVYFYIKDSDGQYLDNGAGWTKDSSRAAEWSCVGNGNTAGTYYVKLNASGKTQWIQLEFTSPTLTTSTRYRTAFSFDEKTGQLVVDYKVFQMPLGTPVVQTAGETKDYTLVTFEGKSVGTTYVTIGGTKYTIIVTDKAPDTALTGSSITLEHWITNGKVVKQKNSENNTTTISKETNGVQTENGVEIKDYAFTPGYWNNSTEVTYWQAVRLDENNKQTGVDGVDQTAVGTTLTHVRYQNNAWQYKTLDGNWQYFRSGDQLVAYYLQKIPVTEEITTYFKDYGYRYSELPQNTSGGEGQVALTVAVVYPDGTVSPAEGNMYSKSTTIFNYWNNRNIGIISAANNSEYTISKITVTDGTRVYSNSYYDIVWQNGDTITWNKKLTDDGKTEWYNETVVWDEQTNAGSPVVNGSDPSCNAVCTWSAKNTAKLVLIYLKPVVKETNLHLAYYDDTHNEQIIAPIDIAMTSIGTVTPTFTTALKDANGNVIGDTASWPGTTSGESSYLPDGAYVVNSSGVHQTFNKNLPTVPGVAPNYKSGVYKYNGAVISDDGKTLTLHYVLDESKLTLTYVFDFGLPINIPVSDLVGDAASSVETVYVGNTDLSTGTAASQHGKLTYDKSTQYITYEPTKAWTAQGLSSVTFKVEFIDKTTQNFIIGVLPASNVLYEENFLTQSGDSGLNWTEGTSVAPTTPQETQKVKAGGNVFGYDDAYVPSDTNPVTGELGVWTATGLVAGEGTTKYLSTEFYGNGFDLIGNCGPDTGRVFLFISGANQIKLVDVDTRYSGSTLKQVPLAHVMLGQEANYQVKVSAAGLKATDATSASYSLSGAATYASDYAVGGYDADLYNVLAENGLTMADVEYVKVESAPAATTRSAASFYALDTADAGGTVTRPAGTHVEIDGFRVYRSTTNANYPTSEQNVKYENVLDAVTFKDGNVAYTELNGAHKLVSREDYESNGGPQNEIYLTKNQSVVFNLGAAMKGQTVQITARAVTGTAAKLNETSISSNTEMYYEVKVGESGTLAIHNSGEGMLAIANLKVPNTVTFNPVTAENLAIAERMLLAYAGASDESNAFDPAISAKVTTTRFIRSKVVTLTVSASSDVAVLKVNGVELRPTNSWLVKMGWSDTYTYILTEKVQKNEIKTYEIVGYRADGTASAPIVVKSK